MSENKEKEKFVELPLCEIISKWGNLPGGEQFVKDIQTSRSLRLCLRILILSEDNIRLIYICEAKWENATRKRQIPIGGSTKSLRRSKLRDS